MIGWPFSSEAPMGDEQKPERLLRLGRAIDDLASTPLRCRVSETDLAALLTKIALLEDGMRKRRGGDH
jgi:hypothetical protein